MWPILRYPSSGQDRLKRKTEILNQNSQRAGGELSLEFSKYKAEVVTVQQQCLLYCSKNCESVFCSLFSHLWLQNNLIEAMTEVFTLHIEGRSQTRIFEFPRNFVGQNVVCEWGFSDPTKLLPSTCDIRSSLTTSWDMTVSESSFGSNSESCGTALTSAFPSSFYSKLWTLLCIQYVISHFSKDLMTVYTPCSGYKIIHYSCFEHSEYPCLLWMVYAFNILICSCSKLLLGSGDCICYISYWKCHVISSSSW